MFHVIATCIAGHRQTIRYDPAFTREWVELQAGLMDGTSPLYIHPPGVDSVIGRCGICGAPIGCQIVETDDMSLGGAGDIAVAPLPGGGIRLTQSAGETGTADGDDAA